MTRREAIARLGAGLGFLSMLRGSPASAQANLPMPVMTPRGDPNFPIPTGWKTEFLKLAPNVYTYIQAGGPGLGDGSGDSNAGVIVGDDHLMVIDTLGQPLRVDYLKAQARSMIGNKPFGRVVDTHQHADHVGGNQFFVPAEIVSHPFCRETVITMKSELPPDAKFPKRDGGAYGTEPRVLIVPDTTFTDKMTYYYSGTPVELSHPGVAHTWGDLIAYVPEHKILFAGDLAMANIIPFAHQGHVTQWIDALNKVLAMDIDVVVPGHGPVGTKQQLVDTREYFVLLKREARKRFDAGMSPGKAAADIRLGKFDNWLGSSRVLLNTFRLYCEFDGSITPMLDVERMKRATEEFNGILKARA
jgi:cyclase